MSVLSAAATSVDGSRKGCFSNWPDMLYSLDDQG